MGVKQECCDDRHGGNEQVVDFFTHGVYDGYSAPVPRYYFYLGTGVSLYFLVLVTSRSFATASITFAMATSMADIAVIIATISIFDLLSTYNYTVETVKLQGKT